MADIIGADSGSDFAFEFTHSTEEAAPPEPLPDAIYRGEITQMTKTLSDRGRRRLILRIVVPPENYPADYSTDNAPDGVTVLYFSQDLEDDKQGLWHMRALCKELKIPDGNKFRAEDFEGKQVEVDLTSRELPDGSRRNNIKGLPKAV